MTPDKADPELEVDISSFILPPANRAQRRSVHPAKPTADLKSLVREVNARTEARRKAQRKAANQSRARNRV